MASNKAGSSQGLRSLTSTPTGKIHTWTHVPVTSSHLSYTHATCCTTQGSSQFTAPRWLCRLLRQTSTRRSQHPSAHRANRARPRLSTEHVLSRTSNFKCCVLSLEFCCCCLGKMKWRDCSETRATRGGQQQLPPGLSQLSLSPVLHQAPSLGNRRAQNLRDLRGSAETKFRGTHALFILGHFLFSHTLW